MHRVSDPGPVVARSRAVIYFISLSVGELPNDEGTCGVHVVRCSCVSIFFAYRGRRACEELQGSKDLLKLKQVHVISSCLFSVQLVVTLALLEKKIKKKGRHL